MPEPESRAVIIYTQPECPACDWARDFLASRKVEFELRDVAADPFAFDELRERYKSLSTPTIVVGEEVMIGFDPERLDAMLAVAFPRR